MQEEKAKPGDHGSVETRARFEPDYPGRNLVLYVGELFTGLCLVSLVYAAACLAAPAIARALGEFLPLTVSCPLHPYGHLYTETYLRFFWGLYAAALAGLAPWLRWLQRWATPAYRRPVPVSGYEAVATGVLALCVPMSLGTHALFMG